jgi:hypothetical protein
MFARGQCEECQGREQFDCGGDQCRWWALTATPGELEADQRSEIKYRPQSVREWIGATKSGPEDGAA